MLSHGILMESRLSYGILMESRKVDVRPSRKGNLNSHSARPVHLIIAMIKWIWTSRLSIQNSLLMEGGVCLQEGVRFRGGLVLKAPRLLASLTSTLESNREERRRF